MVAIQARAVSRTYSNRGQSVRAIKDIDVCVSRGEHVVIYGASGSGKSTLLSIFGCLEKIDAGSLRIDGEEVSAATPQQLAMVRRNKIGFVFQDYNLLDQYTLIENVMLPLLYRGVSKAEARERAEDALMEVGLHDRARHLPSELSGGQKQRGAIARAIVYNPPIILADEPTGALDTEASRVVLDILRGLSGKGHTVVIVSHEPSVVETAPRRIFIEDGVIGVHPANGQ